MTQLSDPNQEGLRAVLVIYFLETTQQWTDAEVL